MEYLILDTGGLMTAGRYAHHVKSIRYHSNLIDRLLTLKKGTPEYIETVRKIGTVQGHIEGDMKEAQETADKLIQN
jgi:hypothetical protein